MTAASAVPAAQLLSGIRVVDFTQALSGPYATLMLADLGADVVKVEAPGRGDDSRHWGPPYVGDDAAYFLSVNRNKRSVELDLKSESGLGQARKLIASADVVVENWRPGVAKRLGLGADRCIEEHPALVYCSISGYGQDQGARSGYDQIVQGTSGAMSLTGPIGSPTKWGIPVADIASGMFAASGILAALLERSRSGRGRVVDVSMQDSLLSMLSHYAARYLATGVIPASDHNSHATIAPYGAYAARDGLVNICVGNDSQFERLLAALGVVEVGEDPRFATNASRVANRAELEGRLGPALASRTVAEVVAALEAVGVPVGAVRSVGEALEDPSTRERGMILGFSRPDIAFAEVVNTPWKFDGASPALRLPPPTLGEHNDDLLGDAGGDDVGSP